MFSKHKLPPAKDCTSPGKVFQDDVEDLYASNLISASRVQNILQKGAAAGANVKKSALKESKGQKNAARTVTRRKLKRTLWPEHYTFDCRVWSPKLNREVLEEISIWLPGEILDTIWELGLPEVILSTEGMDKIGKEHLEWMKHQP